MEIKFHTFKPVSGNGKPEDFDNQAYNVSILADGVRGVTCISSEREPSRGERVDYEHFGPEGSMLSSVEEYANGAKNLHVRSKLEWKKLGVITVRYP